ncbi:hypothetical protein ACFPU0_03475 [Pseudomonas sp. GCM10022186]|uniref:hypothetical protein n=1 Tax=Pseudomonas sp. GCM10022186 TaxID=3252650 RepID=UPI00361C18DD
MLQLSITQIVAGYATPKRETSPKRWSDNPLPAWRRAVKSVQWATFRMGWNL